MKDGKVHAPFKVLLWSISNPHHSVSFRVERIMNLKERTNERERFTQEILGRFKEETISSAANILIKPNIVSYEPYPTTTHPKVLATVLRFFQAFGNDILVADGPAKPIDDHPLKEVCKRFGVPFINVLHDAFLTKRSKRGFRLEVSRIPFQYEFILSLPVLKEHKVCGLTGALKNQFGLLSNEERDRLHRGNGGGKNIHKGIAELNTIIKPDLFIIDAVETLIGAQERRHGGEQRKLGYMLAGVDPLTLDQMGLKLLEKVTDVSPVPSLRYMKKIRGKEKIY